MSLNWQQGRLLSEFSTFGIGGPISYFSTVTTRDEMSEGFSFAKQNDLPFFILGKGSNCLFDDAGFHGIVLQNRLDFIDWKGSAVTVGAGTSFSYLGVKTSSLGFKGLEFASGIPATVGGAIFMNAGANGTDTQTTLKEVEYLDFEKGVRIFSKDQLEFGYRKSSFQKMVGAIMSATFVLEKDSETRQRQLVIIQKRMKSQPLKEKSAGCIFRNPDGFSAGALIDQAALKGFSIGGAAISNIHANFLINLGGATSREVQSLMGIVQQKVFEKTNIRLEPEIRIVGPHG